MVCVADIDKSPGTTEKPEMAALVSKMASGEKEGEKKESHNWLLVI